MFDWTDSFVSPFMSLRTELASLHIHIGVSLRILTPTVYCDSRQVSSIEENAIRLIHVGEVLVFMAL
jgi:hypothetical protein